MGIRQLIDRSRGAAGNALARICLPPNADAFAPPRALDLSQLEDRIMLSASPVGDLALTGDQPLESPPVSAVTTAPEPHEAQSVPAPDNPSGWRVETRVELVFVDQGVRDYEQLVMDLLRDADPVRHFEIVLLDSTRNGIEQISETLEGFHDVNAIHLISHGTAGKVSVGNLWLSDLNIDAFAGEIAGWNGALRDGADVLIYGCDLASTPAGRTLAESLAALCACDVATSDDGTGHARYGGDWELEFTTGKIETEIAFDLNFQNRWTGLLAVLTVDTTVDLVDGDTTSTANLIATPGLDGKISLREAILAANRTEGLDQIHFNIGEGGVQAIQPMSALPPITDAIIIDATTQAGFGGTPIIELDGSLIDDTPGSSSGLTIRAGGSTIRGLVITRFSGYGIVLDGGGENVIAGNDLGAAVAGLLDGGNGRGGIKVIDSVKNTIGGVGPGTGNRIAHNGGAGVAISGLSSAQNAIQGNLIYSNAGLGIDLNNDGPTKNDVGDEDAGPNGLQNSPELRSATTDGAERITIQGELNGDANTTFRIEFFSGPAEVDNPQGPGQTYLGFATVTTDGDGQIAFVATLFAEVAEGAVVSATATVDLGLGEFGGTSEFAEKITVTKVADRKLPPPPVSPPDETPGGQGERTDRGGSAMAAILLRSPASPTPLTGDSASPAAYGVARGEAIATGEIFVEASDDFSGAAEPSLNYGANALAPRTLPPLIREVATQVAETMEDGLTFVLDTMMWQDLDELKRQVEHHGDQLPVIAGSTAGVSTVVTAGYVLWTIRGGWLVSSLLAQMPAWQLVDPLLVLETLRDEDLLDDEGREEDQQVEQMFDEQAKVVQSEAEPSQREQ